MCSKPKDINALDLWVNVLDRFLFIIENSGCGQYLIYFLEKLTDQKLLVYSLNFSVY